MGGGTSVHFLNRIYTNEVDNYSAKCLCYLFLKSLLIRALWNSLLPSFILHSEMTLGTRGRGMSFCLIEPQSHDILGLEDILEVPWLTACILKDVGK